MVNIRVLDNDDYPALEAMDTRIDDDYVKHIFTRLVSGNNRLYGLFQDGQLLSIGGYTIYAGRYAMLGRLRSDQRYKGQGFSTAIMSQMLHDVFQISGIQWAGANTQEFNTSARRVMRKIGLTPLTKLHAAATSDTSALTTGARPWLPITNLNRKKEWIQKMYINTGAPFPYECYYPFPASDSLFQEDDLVQWSFYENEAKTRFLITKADQKKNHYLHAVYPWDDITSQPGLWETISEDYRKLKEQTDGDTYIWMDLTHEKAKSLPPDHTFELPSPWMLHGIDKTSYKTF